MRLRKHASSRLRLSVRVASSDQVAYITTVIAARRSYHSVTTPRITTRVRQSIKSEFRLHCGLSVTPRLLIVRRPQVRELD